MKQRHLVSIAVVSLLTGGGSSFANDQRSEPVSHDVLRRAQLQVAQLQVAQAPDAEKQKQKGGEPKGAPKGAPGGAPSGPPAGGAPSQNQPPQKQVTPPGPPPSTQQGGQGQGQGQPPGPPKPMTPPPTIQKQVTPPAGGPPPQGGQGPAGTPTQPAQRQVVPPTKGEPPQKQVTPPTGPAGPPPTIQKQVTPPNGTPPTQQGGQGTGPAGTPPAQRQVAPPTKGEPLPQKQVTPPTGPAGTPPSGPQTAPTQQGGQGLPRPGGAPPGSPPGTPSATQPGVAPGAQGAPLTPSGVPLPTQQQTRPIAPVAPGGGIMPQSARGEPLRRIDQLRGERREMREGDRTIIREPGRTIIREGDRTIIRHSEVDRFRYGAQDVRVERRGNDNVTVVVRPGGDRIVTMVDDDGYLVRRSRILADGREIVIIDNRPRGPRGPGFRGFLLDLPPPVVRIPREQYIVDTESAPPAMIYDTLVAPPVAPIERAYTLDEIRYNVALRDRMRRLDLTTITFDTGSWEIAPDQIDRLRVIADGINRAIQRNPREVFLIEGHTDAVGADVDNLSLSDRRAESVAIALTQQFNVPAENLATQGYGEQYLKVQTEQAERANRRVAVRRVTPLITGEAQ